MKEVELFIKSSDVQKVSGDLFDLQSLEFKDVTSKDFGKFDHEDVGEKSKQLLAIRSTLSIFETFLPQGKKILTKTITPQEEEQALITKIISETTKQRQHIHASENKLLHLEDDLTRKDVEEGLRITKKDMQAKALTIGYVPVNKRGILRTLKKQKITYRTYKTRERKYFLAKCDVKKIHFPFETYYIPKHLTGTKTLLEEEYAKEKKIIEENKVALHINAHKYHTLFAQEERRVAKELAIKEAKNSFATTKNITLITGFIPEKKVALLEQALQLRVGDAYELHVQNAKEDAPTVLNNATSLKKFEEILHMYSLPSYKEIDPTFILALTFPIFFGFILGDVFYGLIALVFFLFLGKKLPQFKEFIALLKVCSISSILFGIVYGEFMGYEFHGAWYGFFARSHHAQELLIYALAFGFIQINLGVLIGVLNGMKKGFSYALTHHFSWFILEAGVGLLAAGGYFGQAPLLIIGGFLLVLSGVLLYQGHGFAGVIEIPGFFTAIISYARLMAVGLSSITIAVLINDFTGVLFAKGIVGIIAGILLFSIGHIFNIGLGVFEGFLHTMRLHYVEFFTKFYSGGGREFKPFGSTGKGE